MHDISFLFARLRKERKMLYEKIKFAATHEPCRAQPDTLNSVARVYSKLFAPASARYSFGWLTATMRMESS